MPRSLSALRPCGLLCLSLCLALAATARLDAAGPRVLPEGKLPNDQRLAAPKDLDGYFPLAVPATREAWEARAKVVRRQMLVANGLWPMPTKTPVNAVVHGLVDRDDYTVERVFLESYPGHFVTGSLYRPKGKPGKLPTVLCPHGHWPDGRFYATDDATLRGQLATGAERFEVGGRYPLQARCVQLARMGCVVFHYDMEGYADSQQISFDVGHRYGTPRPQMESPDNWGFFSTQAELRLQSVMGLQTYNSIRVLDWLCELPDVDPAKIAVTGASGGGTQTFMLCAVDPRPAVQFPAVMVSTAMQGGCTCENCTLIRVDTGNIEIAGLFAPKPLGMTGADDWTKEIATKGLPELKQLYSLYGTPDNVMAAPLIQFPHNYNHVSRGAMYNWFNRHLQLGATEPVLERDHVPLSREELTVWNESHPKPPAGDEYERSLLKVITADANKQIIALAPHDAASMAKYREVIGGAFETLIGHGLPDAQQLDHTDISKVEHDSFFEFAILLNSKVSGAELPVIFLHPKTWNKQVVLWISGNGKSSAYNADGTPVAEVAKLLAGGYSVAAPDLLFQGEYLAAGAEPAKNRKVANPRQFAGYTYGYNHSLFAERVHDVLTLVAYCKGHQAAPPEKILLVGVQGAGPIVAAAGALSGDSIDRLAIDTAGFRFSQLTAFDDANFLPGATKYGDLPALLALCAPHKLWLTGEGGQVPALVVGALSASGTANGVTVYGGDKPIAAAVDWLMQP